jgi:hypothetical protein
MTAARTDAAGETPDQTPKGRACRAPQYCRGQRERESGMCRSWANISCGSRSQLREVAKLTLRADTEVTGNVRRSCAPYHSEGAGIIPGQGRAANPARGLASCPRRTPTFPRHYRRLISRPPPLGTKPWIKQPMKSGHDVSRAEASADQPLQDPALPGVGGDDTREVCSHRKETLSKQSPLFPSRGPVGGHACITR